MKKQNGITLISLIITIVLLLIIAGTTVYTSVDRFKINNLQKMYNDIELLDDKVENYYLKYGGLPGVKDADNNPVSYTYTTLDFNKDVNDNDNYYIIDLSAIGDVTLNYGEEGYKNPNTSDDVYIINEGTHTIYYVKGIESTDGNLHHSKKVDGNVNEDNISPTTPEIKVISGIKATGSDIYVSEVEIEMVPGKDSWSEINKTTFSINSGVETDISTLTNNIYKITEEGSYEITVKSYDKVGNVSTYTTNIKIVIPEIGDKVAYNELSNGTKTYSIDYTKNGGTSESDSQNLSTEDLEWRILDIEDNGTIELISTNPTKSKVYLNGEQGYLNAETILNNTCNALYGKGENAISARALNVDDIDKLAGITTDEEKKAISSNYKTKWLYRFSDASEYVQYSTDGGVTWIDTTGQTKFKVPGKVEFNSSNHGQEELEYTYYNYTIVETRIKITARDGLSIANLIKNGEENSSSISQWLASQSVYCNNAVGSFQIRIITTNGDVDYYRLIYSNGSAKSDSLSFRPVVSIKTNSILNRDDNGILQLNAVQ